MCVSLHTTGSRNMRLNQLNGTDLPPIIGQIWPEGPNLVCPSGWWLTMNIRVWMPWVEEAFVMACFISLELAEIYHKSIVSTVCLRFYNSLLNFFSIILYLILFIKLLQYLILFLITYCLLNTSGTPWLWKAWNAWWWAQYTYPFPAKAY